MIYVLIWKAKTIEYVNITESMKPNPGMRLKSSNSTPFKQLSRLTVVFEDQSQVHPLMVVFYF